MDEKEAEARPVIGTIFLVLVCSLLTELVASRNSLVKYKKVYYRKVLNKKTVHFYHNTSTVTSVQDFSHYYDHTIRYCPVAELIRTPDRKIKTPSTCYLFTTMSKLSHLLPYFILLKILYYFHSMLRLSTVIIARIIHFFLILLTNH